MNCMKIFRKTFHLVAIDISPSNIVQELLWPPFLFLNKKQPNTENSNYPWNTKLSSSVIKYSVWFHFFTPRVNYGDMNVIESFQMKPFWQYFSMAPFFSSIFHKFFLNFESENFRVIPNANYRDSTVTLSCASYTDFGNIRLTFSSYAELVLNNEINQENYNLISFQVLASTIKYATFKGH